MVPAIELSSPIQSELSPIRPPLISDTRHFLWWWFLCAYEDSEHFTVFDWLLILFSGVSLHGRLRV